MPVVVTFDIERPTPRELNRIRGAFEHLGWQHLGNTAYRYPKLDAAPGPEDWFNHVIPALMMLRAFCRSLEASGRGLLRFTLDTQVSTGCDIETAVGRPPLPAAQVPFTQPSTSGQAFGRCRLRDWVDGVEWPYDGQLAAAGT